LVLGVEYRQADLSDVASIAAIRAEDWGTRGYWVERVSGYMAGTHHPQKALRPRVIYIATQDGLVVGFIAGHLTTRYGCDGELEWVDVIPEFRRNGVASALLRLLAAWFVAQGARRVCVDVVPENVAARGYYSRHGAEPLNEHWLVWKDVGVVVN
jgi:ribosomal protein S18 acetylase RimI-like enzyme